MSLSYTDLRIRLPDVQLLENKVLRAAVQYLTIHETVEKTFAHELVTPSALLAQHDGHTAPKENTYDILLSRPKRRHTHMSITSRTEPTTHSVRSCCVLKPPHKSLLAYAHPSRSDGMRPVLGL